MGSPSNMEVKDQSVTDGQRELKGGAAARQECCKGLTHQSLRCSVALALYGGLARFIMTALLPRCMCQQFEMALAVRCAVNAPSLTRATVTWWGETCSATTKCSECFSDAQHGNVSQRNKCERLQKFGLRKGGDTLVVFLGFFF